MSYAANGIIVNFDAARLRYKGRVVVNGLPHRSDAQMWPNSGNTPFSKPYDQ